MIVVASFTVLWYFTSSKNAVAIQHLVEQVLRSGEKGVGGSSTKLSSAIEIMTILSIFQLLAGLCMACLINFILKRKSKMKEQKQMTETETEETGSKKSTVAIGALHFAGCLCTNLGFAFGSASLVQIVKLLEPIETLIFTVVVTKSLSSVTARKTFSMFAIIIGTSMLLLQKNNNASSNSNAIVFALCSGICMAGRNTAVKKFDSKLPAKEEKKSYNQEQQVDWHMAAVDGIQKFIQITGSATLVSVLALPFAVGLSASGNMISATTLLLSSGWIGLQSIIYHGLYNIASISVLCLISAQSHSLLNVGKRVSNVLVAATVFQENIGIQGIMGLLVAATGGFAYLSSPKGKRRNVRPALKINKILRITTLVIFASFFLFNLNLSYLLTSTYKNEVGETNLSSTGVLTKKTHSSDFLVWMFPFPPPTKEASKMAIDDTLICAYSNACNDYEHHTKINLKALTKDTYFHNYVCDHAYHKVRHMQDFPYHIHAITMMSLLQTRPGACVRTLGSNEKFCDPQPFHTYDPYESIDMKSTNYPFPFVQSDRLGGGAGDLTQLSPDMDQEKFAIWGTEDIPDEQASGITGYNSGEDVQSYASATWLPFISEIRPKFDALLNYTGYYIGNALVNEAMETTENDLKNMHKISLTSIYLSNSGIMKKMQPYLQNYTETIEAFGSRSTATHGKLLAMKIKSYFSACLTLTTDMQGATLERNGTYVHQSNILKPNTSELLSPENKTMILCIDVVNPHVIPYDVRNRAEFAWADIPEDTATKALKKMGRYDYSYKLLSLYANQAKVIITSRIHVGLPAAAMGIPVIFVSVNYRGGKLPGGPQKEGRVAGLLDIFHRVEPESGKNWTFGDLSGIVPPNPGNHLADRYRASFWNRLKKTDFYADTARLYGMVPMQRLGQGNVVTNIQNKFHFILNKSDLSWQTKRAIEHVFFFHPNSQVYVHSNDIRPSDLEVFVESGYDLVVQEYDTNNLEEDAFLRTSMPVRFADRQLSLHFLLLWKYGGVYLSKNTMVVKEIPLSLEDGIFIGEHSGNPAMAHLKKHSSGVFGFFKEVVVKKEHPSLWTLPVLSMEETHKCIEDESWTLESSNSTINSNVLAVSLYPDTFASTSLIKIKSACFKIVEEPCIFCDEIHWDF